MLKCCLNVAEEAGLYPGLMKNSVTICHPDVGRNIKALYEKGGWHIGVVMYCSITLGEFKIDYQDEPGLIKFWFLFLLNRQIGFKLFQSGFVI